METAHPIPQNVTAFQFHLVGDMTLKQFGYLALGMIIAYFSFILLASPLPLLAWPITITSAILGIAFAFIPISDRPLDHWLGAYLRAVYSPTKRLWKKNGHTYQQEPMFIKRLSILNGDIVSIQEPAQPQVTATPAPIQSQPVAAPTPTPPPLPSPEELKKTVDLAKEAQALKTKIIEEERTFKALKEAATQPGANSENYSSQINQVLNNLQNLVSEATKIKRELGEGEKVNFIPGTRTRVTVVPSPRPTQITLTSIPNVINGIIVDANGNYLENVVVVIYDKEGLPVRALKTNKLGQFSGSTPLPSGHYTIDLEKDNLTFDTLQIELSGKILPPLHIAAKRLV